VPVHLLQCQGQVWTLPPRAWPPIIPCHPQACPLIIEWYTIFHPVLYHSSLNPKKNLNYGKWHVWGQLLLLDQVSIRMRPPQAAVINVTVSTLNRQLEKSLKLIMRKKCKFYALLRPIVHYQRPPPTNKDTHFLRRQLLIQIIILRTYRYHLITNINIELLCEKILFANF